MGLFRRSDAQLKVFTVQLIIGAVLFTGITYAAIYVRTRALLYDSVREQAANHTDLVVTARAWNADHNGVWVVMQDGVEPNPYLEELGVDAVVETTDGVRLTLRNPALMTREISNILKTHSGVGYRLVGLKPINPENNPDNWERESLLAFNESTEARYTVATAPSGRRTFRYMEPLLAQTSCLNCHRKQDYELGDIVGATTVEIPLASLDKSLRSNALALSLLGSLSVAAAVSSILWMTRRLGRRIEEANQRLEAFAVTDQLTGLLNRRGTLLRLEDEIARGVRTGSPVSLAMLDLDHFKSVNDTYGHLAGDEALRQVSRIIGRESRPYDIVGRLGGEEFIWIASDTGLEDAMVIAERVRKRIGTSEVRSGDATFGLTTSIGVIEVRPTDALDDALARADAALYEAKAAGRDRVVSG